MHSSDVKTLRGAWSAFWLHQSPRWLAGGFVLLVAARLLAGPFAWADLAVAAAFVAVYPFGEWAIHVFVLHRPENFIAAREHRSHHRHPHNLDTVLLGPKEIVALLLVANPLVAGLLGGVVGLVSGSGFSGTAVLTAVGVGAALVFAYEWAHFLIHTAHRPKTKAYRSIWQNHRLHHFKNEHYWHGITTTVADKLLNTHPDHREVERSPTARRLEAR
jgi:hypothetical protein